MKLKMFFLVYGLFIVSSVIFGGTIHGFVREKGSREPIILGNVWIKDTHIGTATNMKGYYVLPSLSPGTYQLHFSSIGYKTRIIERTIDKTDDIELNISMETEPVLIKGAVVTAERENRELDIKPGRITVQASQMRSIPQVAEPDLFRSLQMLPGVATLSDFSAGLYIRGGSADQNLILLDHIDVYNPNHMFGFFSTFNTDAVKSVELLKGGFPAIYGGRLSSVLNVMNKEGNREEFEGVVRLSLLSSSGTLEGPWKRGSWMISGRRTYLDLAAKMTNVDIPNYYFYDGHGKINFDIDPDNQASISFYLGNDLLDMSQDRTSIRLDWGNQTFSTQWTHLFSSRLFSHFVFAGSGFHSHSKVSFDDVGFGVLNKISDLTLKGTITYSSSIRHSMDFGFETKMLDFKLDYKVVDLDYKNIYSGQYTSLYFQDNLRVGPLDITQVGLRLNHYTDGNYIKVTPRISHKHFINDRIHLTATYGHYTQYLNLVQQEGMSFADMWFPVDETFEPGWADHTILGFNYDNHHTFSISIEGYYKDYGHVAEYREMESRGADEAWNEMSTAQNFFSGKAYAYGGDVYIQNNLWGLEGWIGYSFSMVKKQVDGYNFDQWYHPLYDRRHTIMAIQDYRISRKWRINLAFKYGTGQPYTESTARFAVMAPDGVIYHLPLEGEKNAFRLPPYHRLDIGLFYETTFLGSNTELYLQVVNVYNRENVWYRYYQTYNNPATVSDITMIPLLPTFGISMKF